MSIQVSKKVWELDLKPNLKLVALALADFANEAGECWPSVATIAKLCGIDQRRVRRLLNQLIAFGVIQKRPRFEGNRQKSNVWVFRSEVYFTPDAHATPGKYASGGLANKPEGGVSHRPEGGGLICQPEPSLEPKKEPSEEYPPGDWRRNFTFKSPDDPDNWGW